MPAASPERWDVVVVGAGPAGSSAAFDLARAGLSVRLLDKRAFPRVKPCAGGLTPKALARLRFSVAPVIRRVTRDVVVSHAMRRERRLSSQAPLCALTLRAELDAFLLDRARDEGADFQLVRGLSSVCEHADGVDVTDRTGAVCRARYLLGADGARSQVRRLATPFAPATEAFALEGQVPRSALAGRRTSFTFDFGAVAQGYGWVFPKDDHVSVGLYTRKPADVAMAKPMLRDYARARLGVSDVEHVVGATLGTGGERYVPASERVLLVGDAAGLVDPLLGEGIHNAIASGQAAAAAVIAALRGGASARRSYRSRLAAVQRDVRSCRTTASLFYRWLPLGCALLQRGPVSRAFVEGFAAGRNVDEIGRRALGLGRRRGRAERPASFADREDGSGDLAR